MGLKSVEKEEVSEVGLEVGVGTALAEKEGVSGVG